MTYGTMMSSRNHRSPENDHATRRTERSERFELLEQIQVMLEPAMIVLSLCFLVLLLLDYTTTEFSARNQTRIDHALPIIWVIFRLDFTLRFVIAPAKGRFLRQNWLDVLSLGLPFLRRLRAVMMNEACTTSTLGRVNWFLSRSSELRAPNTGATAASMQYVL